MAKTKSKQKGTKIIAEPSPRALAWGAGIALAVSCALVALNYTSGNAGAPDRPAIKSVTGKG